MVQAKNGVQSYTGSETTGEVGLRDGQGRWTTQFFWNSEGFRKSSGKQGMKNRLELHVDDWIQSHLVFQLFKESLQLFKQIYESTVPRLF